MLRRKRNLPPLGESDAELADDGRVPYAASELRRVPMIKLRYVSAFLLLLVVVAILRGQQYVSLTRSCATPAFAMDTTSPNSGDAVRFSITGPNGTYEMGVDVKEIIVNGKALKPILDTGTQASANDLYGSIRTLHKCLDHSSGTIHAAEGTHKVRLFRIEDSGATMVSEQTITVQPARKR